MLAGLVTGAGCYHRLKTMRLALILSALCYAALAASFGWAALNYETANLTAPVVYGWVAACQVTLVFIITATLRKGRV